MMRYPVYEKFHTWQGEGSHMGRAAAFIRLHGCPVHCPWCDSAGTWHPDYRPEHIEEPTAKELASWAQALRPDFVVITGGEPAIHNLAPLTDALHAVGLPVHLETCGGFAVNADIDWITLSPKERKPPLTEMLERAHEQKWIIDAPEALSMWANRLPIKKEQAVWLHPEWSQRESPAVLTAISEWVKTQGAPYRAGIQAHKYYRVDTLDKASRPPVPLGGKETLGY